MQFMAVFMLLQLEHTVKFMTGVMWKARYRKPGDACLIVKSQPIKTRVKTSQAPMNLCWISVFVSCDGSDFGLELGALKPDSECHGTMDWWHSCSYFPKCIPAGIKNFLLLCLWMHVLVSTLQFVWWPHFWQCQNTWSVLHLWPWEGSFPQNIVACVFFFKLGDLSDSICSGTPLSCAKTAEEWCLVAWGRNE